MRNAIRFVRTVLAIISILSAVFTIACSGDSSTGSSNTLVLSGSVHVLGASTRVPGVAVTAQGRSTSTDANGEFSISGLQPGQTTIALSKEGFQTETIVVELTATNNRFSIAIEPL